MTLEMTMMVVAIGATSLAFIMGIVKLLKKPSHESNPREIAHEEVAVGAFTASAASTASSKAQNKRGWKPRSTRYYFKDNGHLHDTIEGIDIIDMMIIAELCGITDFVPDETEMDNGENAVDEVSETSDRVDPVGSETTASLPPEVETVSSSPTKTPPPEPAPAPSYDGGGYSGSGYDGGGYGGDIDSGGDSGGGD